jgi:hypothetical protein
MIMLGLPQHEPTLGASLALSHHMTLTGFAVPAALAIRAFWSAINVSARSRTPKIVPISRISPKTSSMPSFAGALALGQPAGEMKVPTPSFCHSPRSPTPSSAENALENEAYTKSGEAASNFSFDGYSLERTGTFPYAAA